MSVGRYSCGEYFARYSLGVSTQLMRSPNSPNYGSGCRYDCNDTCRADEWSSQEDEEVTPPSWAPAGDVTLLRGRICSSASPSQLQRESMQTMSAGPETSGDNFARNSQGDTRQALTAKFRQLISSTEFAELLQNSAFNRLLLQLMDDPGLLNELFSMLREHPHEEKIEEQEQEQDEQTVAKLDQDEMRLHGGHCSDDLTEPDEWISHHNLTKLDDSIARAEARLERARARATVTPGPTPTVKSSPPSRSNDETSSADRSESRYGGQLYTYAYTYAPSLATVPWTPESRTSCSPASPTSWDGLATHPGSFSPRPFRQIVRSQEQGATNPTRTSTSRNLYI